MHVLTVFDPRNMSNDVRQYILQTPLHREEGGRLLGRWRIQGVWLPTEIVERIEQSRVNTENLRSDFSSLLPRPFYSVLDCFHE